MITLNLFSDFSEFLELIKTVQLAMKSTIFPFPQVGQGFVLSISAIATGLYGLKVNLWGIAKYTDIYA